MSIIITLPGSGSKTGAIVPPQFQANFSASDLVIEYNATTNTITSVGVLSPTTSTNFTATTAVPIDTFTKGIKQAKISFEAQCLSNILLAVTALTNSMKDELRGDAANAVNAAALASRCDTLANQLESVAEQAVGICTQMNGDWAHAPAIPE